MIGMLSALFSAQARLTICFQPPHGIWLGFWAWMPGSSCGLGASGGGVSGSPRSGADVAFAAAARRAAFSSTRSRIRSTALSWGLVPVMAVPPVGAAVAGTGPGPPLGRSVARPGAGQLGEPAGPGAVDGGLRRGEDGALERGGEDHLAHRVLALQRGRCVVLVRHSLPDLLEDDPAQAPGEDATDEADRPVGDLCSLAQRFLLRMARLLRTTIRPNTSPTSVMALPIPTGGLSR